MSDPDRPSSPFNSASLHVPQIFSEQVLKEEEHLTGSSGGVAGSPAQPSATPAAEPHQAVGAVPSASQTTNFYPSYPHRPTRKESFLGIPQPSAPLCHTNPNYDDDNYETRFPPDPLYQEVSSPNARVYRVYIEESAKYDAHMTDEAREGLDVLLVFAGLFSAVLTTFVAQTSQSLLPDRVTESTLLLREVTALQRAQISGASIDSIPSTPTDFAPSSMAVWVNGLWFTSLMLSLICALLAVLMKQWIRYYMSFVSGTAKERSLIRQYRFMGLQKWHVPTLIGILPVLMHLSLAIFFVGLTLFLIPLHRSIAGIVGCLSALVFTAYIATAVLPLFRIQCPYRTPLSPIIHDITFWLREYILGMYWVRYVSLKEQELSAAAQLGHSLVAHAFKSLLSMSSNLSVHRVVAQAMGGLIPKSALTQALVDKKSLQSAWNDMLSESISISPDGARILPHKVNLLDRLFRTALHFRSSSSFSWTIYDSDICTAIESFPAPTLQWASVATALLWHYGCTKSADFKDRGLAEKAYAVVGRLMSESPDDETRLPVIVWEDLLAAASSCPSVLLPDSSDSVYNLNKFITDELTSRVRSGRQPANMYDDVHSISFKQAVQMNDSFVWFLLSPFDKHKANSLDSENVQRLLSLVEAIVSHGLCEVSRDIFFGTCKELICELDAGSVTLKDQEAICGAADALLQAKPGFQDNFGPKAILLPSLLFLRCWTPHVISRSASKEILVDLINIDMFKVFHKMEGIGRRTWSATHNINAPVASLIASLIRTSFELQMGPGAQPEDSRWLEYLCLPTNGAAIVSLFALQGTTQRPASVVLVRNDLLLFFSGRPVDRETLQECKTSLDLYLYHYPRDWPDPLIFEANVKEAKKVLDEFISEQTPQPGNLFTRCLGRSRKSADLEAGS